ncbi:putative caspase-like protein [Catenulispora sp. GAS73]|uniref:caspase family protein n=1 Tax=Catenulispora sp. GAS73 TaxID=3156269 RepID=UPI003519A972
MYRALLVCNSTFPEDPVGLSALYGPRADGLHLWRALTDLATSMFDPAEVEALYERTHGEIGAAAEDFFRSARRGDVLLFYYSGHGRRTASRKRVLCARDSRSDRLETTTVRSEAIKDLINASSAEATIVVLDCCHGAAFGKGEEDLAADLKVKGEGHYVIAAASAAETAPDADHARLVLVKNSANRPDLE